MSIVIGIQVENSLIFKIDRNAKLNDFN